MSKDKTIKNPEPEGLYARISNKADIGFRFNSAYGKILYFIVAALLVFGFLGYKLIEINPFLGFIFILILVGIVVWFVKETLKLIEIWPWLFLSAELVLPMYKMISLGQKGKEEREIENLPIVKQTVEETFSARVSKVHPNKFAKLKVGTQ